MEINTYKLDKHYTSKLFVYKKSIWLSSIGKPKFKEIEERENKESKIKFHKETPFEKIQSIKTNQTGVDVKVKYFKGDKLKTSNFRIDSIENKNNFIEDLKKEQDFKEVLEKENPYKQSIENFIILFFCLAFGIYILSIKDIQNSGLYTTRVTRNQGILEIVKLIIDSVGQNNTAYIFIAISAFIMYKIIARFKNPKKNIILSLQ